MDKEIYGYNDYKAYLNGFIAAKPGRGRGVKSAIASTLECQTSYVSQVLNENAHLSLEQGDKLNKFLGHSIEGVWIFSSAHSARARWHALPLKKHWGEREIDLILEKRLVLRDRLDVRRTLSRGTRLFIIALGYIR